MQSEFGKAVAVFFFLRKAKRPSERCLLQCPAHSFPVPGFLFYKASRFFLLKGGRDSISEEEEEEKRGSVSSFFQHPSTASMRDGNGDDDPSSYGTQKVKERNTKIDPIGPQRRRIEWTERDAAVRVLL